MNLAQLVVDLESLKISTVHAEYTSTYSRFHDECFLRVMSLLIYSPVRAAVWTF